MGRILLALVVSWHLFAAGYVAVWWKALGTLPKLTINGGSR